MLNLSDCHFSIQ
jgi:hypothetical protein